MSTQSSITLFSSESTTKYIKDIFTVLALPRDAEYQFRYETKYVDSNVRNNIFNAADCFGTKALVAFRSQSTEELDKRFIIPIRWVEIIKVSFVADFYTVRFKVKCYPSFSTDFKNNVSSFERINAFAKEILNNRATNELAVVSNILTIVGNHNDDKTRDNEYWQNIVSIFSLLPQYENYYFLRFSSFAFSNEKLCPFENNITTLEEEKCAYINIDYYQRKYNSVDDSKIEVNLDTNIISQSSGLRTKMETRYDSIRLGFQPKNTMNGTVSEIIICTTDSSNKKQTEVSFPIRIVKRKYSRAVKAIIMSIGACLIAMPGLLPNTFDIKWKIIIAITGASVMGLNHFIDLRGKK